MKRKLLSCLLALCMTAALVVPAIAKDTGGNEVTTPTTTFTPSDARTPGVETYTGTDHEEHSAFFANGTPIVIDENGEGTGLTVTWEGGSYDYAYVSGNSTFHVYGGGFNDGKEYAASSVTVNGGKLSSVYGGGMLNTRVVDAYVEINGGTVIGSGVNGGGACGGTKHSSETAANYSVARSKDKSTAFNQVENAVILFNGGKTNLLYGGGQGYSYVGNVQLTMRSGSADYLTAGGSNGYTDAAKLTVEGGAVGVMQSVNRGGMRAATMDVTGGTVTNLYIGGETDDSSVTGTINGSVDAAITGSARVTNVYPGKSNSVEFPKDSDVIRLAYTAGTVTNIDADKFGNALTVLAPAAAPWQVYVPNGGSAETTAKEGEFLLKGAAVAGGSGDPGMFTGPYVKYDTLGIAIDPVNGFSMSVELKAPAVEDMELFAWTFGVNGPDGNRVTETVYAFQKSGGAVQLTSVGGAEPIMAATIAEGGSFVLRTEFYASENGKLAARCYVDDALAADISPLKNDSGEAVDYTDIQGPRYGWLCSSTVAAGLLAKLPTAAALAVPEAPVYALSLTSDETALTTADAAGIQVTAAATKDGAPFDGGVYRWELSGKAADLLELVPNGAECTVKPDPAKAAALDALDAPVNFQVKASLYADDSASDALAAATTGALTLKPIVPGAPEPVPVASVTLDKTALTLTAKGATAKLTAAVAPADADEQTVAWSSDNTKVATVDQNGLVTAVAGGRATVTATAGGKSAACTVTVSISTGGGTYYPPSGGGSTATPSEPAAPPTIDEAQALSDLKDSGMSGIQVEVSEPVVVDGTLFAAAGRSKKDMTFAVVDDSGELLYQWEFDGREITLPQVAMSLGIEFLELGEKGAETIGALAKKDEGLVLSFQHAGQLPGPARVTVNVAARFLDGAKLYYYYYNPSANRLELVAEGLTVNGGRVTLPQTHCSEYLLTTEEIAGATVITPPPVIVNPQTGDSNPAIGWMAALLLAAGGLLVLLKKKARR